MQRILGQDMEGFWHIAASTYSSTMQSKCGRWMKVMAFAIEEASKQHLPINHAPWCVTCVYVCAVDGPLPNKPPHH